MKPELLSPAGDWESLDAALKNGADAVYLGVREFNARIPARNFTMVELEQATGKAHRQGVRVYLAMNTLVKDEELESYFATLSRAYAVGIDGVIVQHVSFVDLIKSSYPGLKVFASTQAAIGNVSAAGLLRGADRVILPREVTLAEARAMVNSGAKVEVFVHGALCFSYSGMCLFSSFVGNRSGNRGCCAQLCRKKFGGSYCLSMKELCLVGRIPELVEAGIRGFKIEGRMRSPLYVAVATRLYRKAIDSYTDGAFVVPPKEMAEMEVVFNRGYTEGFMFGEHELVAAEKPMNRGAYLGTLNQGRIKLDRPVAVGDGVGIWGKKAVTGAIIRTIRREGTSLNRAETGEEVDLALDAPDGTRIFLTSAPAIKVEPDFTPTRTPVVSPHRHEVRVRLPQVQPRKSGGARLMVKVYSAQEARASAKVGADAVFYDVLARDFPPAGDWPEGVVRGAYIPRILNEAELTEAVERVRAVQPAAVLTGNIGFLAYRDEFKGPVYLDYNLNAFNGLDLAFFREYRATPVLSPELTMAEMLAMPNKDAVLLCHGDIALMNTRVALKDKDMVDEKGFRFPVRREANYWQILNSQPLGMFNDVRQLVAAGFGQLLIDRAGDGPRMVELYRRILKEEVSDRRLRRGHTSGHLYRPVG